LYFQKKKKKKKNNQTNKKQRKNYYLNAFHGMSNRCSPAVFAKNVFEPLASRASRFTRFTSPDKILV
jgi:hypothetical protein